MIDNLAAYYADAIREHEMAQHVVFSRLMVDEFDDVHLGPAFHSAASVLLTVLLGTGIALQATVAAPEKTELHSLVLRAREEHPDDVDEQMRYIREEHSLRVQEGAWQSQYVRQFDDRCTTSVVGFHFAGTTAATVKVVEKGKPELRYKSAMLLSTGDNVGSEWGDDGGDVTCTTCSVVLHDCGVKCATKNCQARMCVRCTFKMIKHTKSDAYDGFGGEFKCPSCTVVSGLRVITPLPLTNILPLQTELISRFRRIDAAAEGPVSIVYVGRKSSKASCIREACARAFASCSVISNEKNTIAEAAMKFKDLVDKAAASNGKSFTMLVIHVKDTPKTIRLDSPNYIIVAQDIVCDTALLTSVLERFHVSDATQVHYMGDPRDVRKIHDGTSTMSTGLQSHFRSDHPAALLQLGQLSVETTDMLFGSSVKVKDITGALRCAFYKKARQKTDFCAF